MAKNTTGQSFWGAFKCFCCEVKIESHNYRNQNKSKDKMSVLPDQDHAIVYTCIFVLLKFKSCQHKANIKTIINQAFYTCNRCITSNKKLLDSRVTIDLMHYIHKHNFTEQLMSQYMYLNSGLILSKKYYRGIYGFAGLLGKTLIDFFSFFYPHFFMNTHKFMYIYLYIQ